MATPPTSPRESSSEGSPTVDFDDSPSATLRARITARAAANKVDGDDEDEDEDEEDDEEPIFSTEESGRNNGFAAKMASNEVIVSVDDADQEERESMSVIYEDPGGEEQESSTNNEEEEKRPMTEEEPAEGKESEEEEEESEEESGEEEESEEEEEEEEMEESSDMDGSRRSRAAFVGLEDLDLRSLRKNLEVAIGTIREMQERLVASNRAIETVTRERNSARRELAGSEKLCVRLTSAAEVSRLAAQNTNDLAVAKVRLEGTKEYKSLQDLHSAALEKCLEQGREELKAQADQQKSLALELKQSRSMEETRVLTEKKLDVSEALFESAKGQLERLEGVESELGLARDQLDRASVSRAAMDAAFDAAFAIATGEQRRAERAESRHAASLNVVASLEADVRALQEATESRKRESLTDERRRAGVHKDAVLERTTVLNRAITAERTVDDLERRLEDLDESNTRASRAHLGARFTLERSRQTTEADVQRAFDARRQAQSELEATKDQLRVEVRCRSAASVQLKEARLKRDVERQEKEAVKSKYRELTTKYKRQKAEIDELKKQHRLASSTSRSAPSSNNFSTTTTPIYRITTEDAASSKQRFRQQPTEHHLNNGSSLLFDGKGPTQKTPTTTTAPLQQRASSPRSSNGGHPRAISMTTATATTSSSSSRGARPETPLSSCSHIRLEKPRTASLSRSSSPGSTDPKKRLSSDSLLQGTASPPASVKTKAETPPYGDRLTLDDLASPTIKVEDIF